METSRDGAEKTCARECVPMLQCMHSCAWRSLYSAGKGFPRTVAAPERAVLTAMCDRVQHSGTSKSLLHRKLEFRATHAHFYAESRCARKIHSCTCARSAPTSCVLGQSPRTKRPVLKLIKLSILSGCQGCAGGNTRFARSSRRPTAAVVVGLLIRRYLNKVRDTF